MTGRLRTGSERKRWLLTLLSIVLLLHHAAWASSRSPSRPPSRRTKGGKKRRPINPREDAADPHGGSSSSPSFLPLVFSDNEWEEDILSALARLDDDDDDKDEDEQEEVKQKATLKKVKGEVKKAISSGKVERSEKEQKHKKEQKVSIPVQAAENVLRDAPMKEASLLSNSQPSLGTSNLSQRSAPRQNMSPPSSDLPNYPPRPNWNRTTQQPLQRTVTQGSLGAMPPPTRTMPASGIRSPQTSYPYAPPPGTVTPLQPFKQSQKQQVDATTSRWIRKFLAARSRDTLLPIPREYLSDGFNLVQLAPVVEGIARTEGGYGPPVSSNESFPLFKAALRLILSNDDEPSSPVVQRAAEVLYTLVHARYLISPRGLDTVRRVLRRSDGTVNPVFGRCPRIRCRGMPLLPCGDSDNYDPRNSVTTRAKRYCPCCGEVSG
jgi:hypothetical protein